MKFTTTLLLITLFYFNFAHQVNVCKNNEDCLKNQICNSKNVCIEKSELFCQNDLSCQLRHGKNSRCILKTNEKFGNCQQLYTPGGPCKSNAECSATEYCTGDKKTNKVGKCTTRPSKFCQNITQCKVGEKCEKITHNLGFCKPFDDGVSLKKTSMHHLIKDKFIPPITPEAYAAAPMNIGEKNTHKCGMEDFDVGISSIAATCNKQYTCDSVATRDKYSTPPSGNATVYKIRWLFFKCGSGWETNAQTRIAEATGDLNTYFKDIGYQFNSYYNEYTCQGSGTTNNDQFTQNTAFQAVTREIGAGFQATGFLHVVVGQPSDDQINGWFFLPGSTSSGTGFMHTRVVAKGYSTLAHELGHGFGLYHTFRGISEVTTCSDGCREDTVTSTNDVGDFCADTPPVGKNWDCTSPSEDTKNGKDPCSSKNTWNPNPYQNIMSYGNCRYQFTTQQKSRIRCFQNEYLNFLKEDTNPVQNPASSTLPTPAVPRISITFCAGFPWVFPFPCPFGAASSATYSLIGIVTLLFYTLLA
eukprot:gene8593-418_t